MRILVAAIVSPLLLAMSVAASAQTVMSGRLWQERFPGSTENMPLTAILCFASLDGTGSQASGFRTFETYPAGWYRLSGSAGNYTLAFSNPASFMRPIVMTNVYTQPGDMVDRHLAPQHDYAIYFEGAWDEKAASDYYQTFVAKGKSITSVGFKVVHDGVDGGGPAGQNLIVSIHRKGPGAPDKWEQVGPAVTVFNVDSGGAKIYTWSAGWNSGEVPTEPGETYAVRLRPEQPDGTFQAFWRPNDDKTTDCYRIGADNTGWQGRDIWMAVGGDSDGLLIPYNKRVHKQFCDYSQGAPKWSQTYVAQGRGLAAVILYVAISGTQPGIYRQRAAIRVRRGGPDGPVVGIEKIAIGNGNYTGDASWGTFGVAFAPGEVPLEPGETYAIEAESIENDETLGGFVNIKGEPSNMVPGFTPYRKCAPDSYERGTAYLNGKQAMDYDLDMQVIEYEYAAENWSAAVDAENLLANGDMDAGELKPDNFDASHPDAWQRFTIDAGTAYWYLTDGKEAKNRIVRVIGGSISGQTVDGGYVQRVDGLSHLETYRLSGNVRSSWPVDDQHQCYVGYDPTGQEEDPKADTIVWTTLPEVHGVWVPFMSDPIRPAADAISVWLRGRTTSTADFPFKADFDDFALHRVQTEPPGG